MVDIPERYAEDDEREQVGARQTEYFTQRMIFDKILWPWHNKYPSDRHVAPLFFRTDSVLHQLADLIAEQLTEARAAAIIEQRFTAEQQAKLNTWRTEQDALRNEHVINDNLTFESIPTTLGIVQRVWYCKGTPYEAMLDLTDRKD